MSADGGGCQNPVIRVRSGTNELHVAAQKGGQRAQSQAPRAPSTAPAPEAPHGRLSLVTADRREGCIRPPAREAFGFGDRRPLFLCPLFRQSPVPPSLLGRDLAVEFLPISLFWTRANLSLWCRARVMSVFAVHSFRSPAAPLRPRQS